MSAGSRTPRYPLRDQVAIVGIGQTPYGREPFGRTQQSLAMEAVIGAIRDAGLAKSDIDGMVGYPSVEFEELHEGLGLGVISYGINPMGGAGLGAGIAEGAHAVFSGACEIAVVTHSTVRLANPSSAGDDPLRTRKAFMGTGKYPSATALDHAGLWAHTAGVYPAMAARYLHDFGVPRDLFGLIAINSRSNAIKNDHAVERTPFTMDDYLGAELVRGPFGLLDLDAPVDGADAVILTTVERARDLAHPPVLLHVAAFGEPNRGPIQYEQAPDYRELGPWLSASVLWQRSELALSDIDVFYPYDGMPNFAVTWLEAVGYCGAGEAWDFLRQHWNDEENRVLVDGRIPFLTNGGHLSEGVNAAAGAVVEAVRQLRGDAGARQVPDCKSALIALGALLHNSHLLLLRRD